MTVFPSDLATLLGDTSINTTRAQAMIDDAVALCQSVVNPLPAGADVVVKRVAARGYLQTSARQYQLASADAPYGASPGPVGGVTLLRVDKADLRRLAGGGGAFTIDLLPADYVAPVSPSPWDDPILGGSG